MRVFAIDPGTTESAYCVIDRDTLRPLVFGKTGNVELREIIRGFTFDEDDRAAIEMLQNYGNLIGRDVLETAVWIGIFHECLRRKPYAPPAMVFRMEEKMHICHDSKAKDKNIRCALIACFAKHDLKNGRGTKKNPDFFYGFKADIWSAYAVGLTYIETKLED